MEICFEINFVVADSSWVPHRMYILHFIIFERSLVREEAKVHIAGCYIAAIFLNDNEQRNPLYPAIFGEVFHKNPVSPHLLSSRELMMIVF